MMYDLSTFAMRCSHQYLSADSRWVDDWTLLAMLRTLRLIKAGDPRQAHIGGAMYDVTSHGYEFAATTCRRHNLD